MLKMFLLEKEHNDINTIFEMKIVNYCLYGTIVIMLVKTGKKDLFK